MKCRLVPEDALGVDLGYGVDGGEAEVLAAVLLEVGTHAVEVSASLPNGFERAPVALQEEEDAGQGIEPAATPHDALQFLVGQVLIEQEQVVAEVEVSLAGDDVTAPVSGVEGQRQNQCAFVKFVAQVTGHIQTDRIQKIQAQKTEQVG